MTVAVNAKKAKSKYGLAVIPLLILELALFSILGMFVGLLTASVIGIVINVSAFFILRRKSKSAKLSDMERVVSTVALMASIFLLLDALILGGLYSSGNFPPAVIDPGFPTASQVSSSFSTNIVHMSSVQYVPGTYYNTGVMGAGEVNYFAPGSTSATPTVTVAVFELNNSTAADAYYNRSGLLSRNGIEENYSGTSYVLFDGEAYSRVGNYVIAIYTDLGHSTQRLGTLMRYEMGILRSRAG